MRGGARNYFPLPAAVTDGASLAANVDFFSVSAHGSLNDRVFMVPENTYILFMGAAGMPIYRRAYQLPAFRDYRFLKDGETGAQWHDRQSAAIQARKFFSDYLYKSNAPYAPNTTAIYEPGDIVQDLTLSFENDAHPFMLLGVWTCPIDPALRVQYDETNQQLQIAKEELTQASRELMDIRKRLEAITSGPQNVMQILQISGEIEAAKATYDSALKRYDDLNPKGKALQDALPGHPNNIAFKMGLHGMSEATLHEVIFKTRSPKPIRFFIVEACRSLEDARLVSQNLIGHVMRAHKTNFEHSKPIRDAVANYESKAHMRRRMSLLARQIEPVAALTYVTPAFTYNMRSISRIPQARPVYDTLMSGAPIPLDAVESALAEFTRTGQALIDANVDTMVAGLAPQKRFKPGDLVKVSPSATSEFDAIVLGPVMESGRVMFNLVRLIEAGTKVIKVSPLLMKKSDEDADDFKAMVLSYGFDLGAEIERAEAERLLALQGARTANVAFGEGMPAAAAGPRVNLLKNWIGDYATNPGRYGDEWARVGPTRHFKTGNRVRIFDSPKPELVGKEATVRGIGIIPAGTHKDKLMYKLQFNDGREKSQVANSLELVGGGKAHFTKRRGRRRRRHTRKH